MSGHTGPAVVFDRVFKAFWAESGAAKRVVLGSGRERPLHLGQERHGEKRDAETPHGVNQAGPGKHLG